MKTSFKGLTATALYLVLVPATIGASPEKGKAMGAQHKRVARLTASAQEAMARGVPSAAVRQAEAAVFEFPRDAPARALLGRAYLAAGRFQSAETALADALALDAAMPRVAINRALAQIALGRSDEAVATLDAVRGAANDTDVGLALALLGKPDEARPLLIAAARAPGADARVRQNLAFAYALEGRWTDAAVIAAQDVPADLVADRLRRWAMVGQLRANPAMQVGAMLGVLPAADPGQPATLALAADPAAARPPVILSRVTAPAAIAPRLFSAAAPAILSGEAPVRIELSYAATPYVVAPGTIASLSSLLASKSAFAEQPRMVAFAGPPVMRSSRVPTRKPRGVPIQTISAIRQPLQLVAHSVQASRVPAKWAVQIGAYSTHARTEIAWTRLSKRATFLADYTPTGSGFRRRGAMLHRLSISGLDSAGAAMRLCARIKASGGRCFIRSDGGEQPMRWTLRARAEEPA
ncbi:MAG: tetratricopeptide repeat protein [Pseudomonadota bacterium]